MKETGQFWQNETSGVSTLLQREEVLFIFADLHPGLVQQSKTISPESLAVNSGNLAKVAKMLSLPSLFLTVPQGNAGNELIDELRDFADQATTFHRINADPFGVKPIREAIRSSGKKTLIVSGFSAEVAVLLTTLSALRHGYSVQIPVDSIGSRSSRTEEAVMRQAERAGAILTSATSVVAQLSPDFSQEPGKSVLTVISGFRT
ncbi:nicotinamidase-related amidase [Erwinia toletana]|uniref:Nicotinamidase-related amidase n=1 Tax=Winslowiella toletana TaxID=92490 RepID=A0ABS4PDR6_9GAMM|nr:isochorismatase family protein [Winslowiella toletana]MBP2170757.1 nicotinamidase-related amidase [Winslowiella toletana]